MAVSETASGSLPREVSAKILPFPLVLNTLVSSPNGNVSIACGRLRQNSTRASGVMATTVDRPGQTVAPSVTGFIASAVSLTERRRAAMSRDWCAMISSSAWVDAAKSSRKARTSQGVPTAE